MGLCPVKKGYLKLRKFWKYARHLVSFTQLLFHFFYNALNAGIVLVFVKGSVKVKLAVFLYLYAEVVKLLNRSVAGKEILGTGAKTDHLKVVYADNGSCYGNKVVDHFCRLIGSANGVFGNICLDVP